MCSIQCEKQTTEFKTSLNHTQIDTRIEWNNRVFGWPHLFTFDGEHNAEMDSRV